MNFPRFNYSAVLADFAWAAVNSMNLWRKWRRLWQPPAETINDEPLLGPDEDPFTEPVELEIRAVIDLHTIPPRQVKIVVEEYLREARLKGFRSVRIIHGKGRGVQRDLVRSILARAPFVIGFYDAPPEAGGLGATIAELAAGSDLPDAQVK